MVIAVANRKGGVGKTTTAKALGEGIARRGYKVLLVDLDPQGNLTATCGLYFNIEVSVLDVLHGTTVEKAAVHYSHGDVLTFARELAWADLDFQQKGKEYMLRRALESAKLHYDFIIIDTPPALGILTTQALTAADRVIITAQADTLCLQGADQLLHTVSVVRQYCNPQLQVDGLLLTRYNPRTALSRQVYAQFEQLMTAHGSKVYETSIREGTAVREAAAFQQSIYDYAPKANVTTDYDNFTVEFLRGAAQ